MRNVCVYCGSSPGRREDYVAAARAFARELVARGMGLVYGGASVGVMGAVADAVLAEGGRVTGVIPLALQEKELAHPGLTELHVTGSMHERKTRWAGTTNPARCSTWPATTMASAPSWITPPKRNFCAPTTAAC